MVVPHYRRVYEKRKSDYNMLDIQRIINLFSKLFPGSEVFTIYRNLGISFTRWVSGMVGCNTRFFCIIAVEYWRCKTSNQCGVS